MTYKFCKNRIKAKRGINVAASHIIAVFMAIAMVLLAGSAKYLCDAVVKAVAQVTQSAERVQEITERLVPYGYDYAIDTLTDRTLIWPATVNMINERPIRWLIGITAPQSANAPINYIYEGRPELNAVFAHNGYLQNVFMYGIPGAIILLIILIFWCINGIKAYFCSCGSSDTLTETYMVPFAVIGILLGMIETYPFPYRDLHLVTYMFFVAAGSCCGAVDANITETKEQAKSKRNLILKRSLHTVLLTAFAVSVIFSLFSSTISKLQKNKPAEHTGNTQDINTIMLLLEDSIEEKMLSPEYWIQNCAKRNLNASEVLLDTEKIDKLNYQNRKRLSSANISFALEDVGIKFNGTVLKSFISDSMSEFKKNGEYSRKVENIEELWTYVNLEAIGPNVDVLFGYSVNRTTLRKLPGAVDAVYADSDVSRDYDMMAVAELMPFAQLVVLHTTVDGEWLYVLTEDCGGWVPREYVACCDNREEWLDVAKRRTENGFVVIIAKSIILNGIEIPMGTTIDATPALEGGVRIGYFLQIPVSSNGRLVFETMFLVNTDGICYNAYLPYTQENVLKQAFKFLGDEYGWAGTKNSVDCSLLTKQVYSTFGLYLPRNSSVQTEFYGADIKDFFISAESKYKYLEKMPAGSLLYFPGHIMLYLGSVDGVPYCISSVGTLETVDMRIGETLAVNRVLVSNMNYTTRVSGVSWLNSVEKIICFK